MSTKAERLNSVHIGEELDAGTTVYDIVRRYSSIAAAAAENCDVHTYIRVFCIAHINSIESLCASVAKQVSFRSLFESVK